MTGTEPRLPGRRVVAAIYLAIVAIAGIFGYVIGTIVTAEIDPRLFFLIELPATPLGMAVYGALTIAALLGVLLGLVEYVSKKTGAAAR